MPSSSVSPYSPAGVVATPMAAQLVQNKPLGRSHAVAVELGAVEVGPVCHGSNALALAVFP